jgi:hypothetical protein
MEPHLKSNELSLAVPFFLPTVKARFIIGPRGRHMSHWAVRVVKDPSLGDPAIPWVALGMRLLDVLFPKNCYTSILFPSFLPFTISRDLLHMNPKSKHTRVFLFLREASFQPHLLLR